MASIAAANVAKEVLETIGRGEMPNVGEIARKKGYANATAKNPQQIKKTASYKNVVNPFLARLEKHRERVLASMEGKDLDEEEYKVLSDSLTKITHDVQLLSGGKTENVGLEEDRKTLQMIIASLRT